VFQSGILISVLSAAIRLNFNQQFNLRGTPMLALTKLITDNQQMSIVVLATKHAPRPWRPTPLRPPMKKAC
jgi:hypothetical protein